MSDAYPDLCDKPRYRRDAYDLGPFEYPPSEMRERRFDEPTTPEWPTLSPQQQTAEYGRLWLLAALDEHDVAVHLYDCEAALVIAEAGISVAPRPSPAGSPAPPSADPEPSRRDHASATVGRRPTPSRLLQSPRHDSNDEDREEAP